MVVADLFDVPIISSIIRELRIYLQNSYVSLRAVFSENLSLPVLIANSLVGPWPPLRMNSLGPFAIYMTLQSPHAIPTCFANFSRLY